MESSVFVTVEDDWIIHRAYDENGKLVRVCKHPIMILKVDKE